jgi:hypothetical protein
MKAVFQVRFLRFFSGDFRPTFCSFPQEKIGNRWKNPVTPGLEYCFHVPLISDVFLQVPVRFLRLSGQFQ